MARNTFFHMLFIFTVMLAVGTAPPAHATSSGEGAISVESTIQKMVRREGVSRVELESLRDSLLRAYQLQEPGAYFETYSPAQIAELVKLYGQTDLAMVLRQWSALPAE